jgi:hypothetical protein
MELRMFKPILALLVGIVLALGAGGVASADHPFPGPEPVDVFADDSPCDPSARYAGNLFIYQYEMGLCSYEDVLAATALNEVIQEMFKSANPKIRFSDYPCTIYDPVGGWHVYLSSQGVGLGSPGTFNVWTTFGGVEVCPAAERLGKDPLSQYAKLSGQSVEDVRGAVANAVNAKLGFSLAFHQPGLAANIIERMYPSTVEGFNPPRPTLSDSQVIFNPADPCHLMMANRC